MLVQFPQSRKRVGSLHFVYPFLSSDDGGGGQNEEMQPLPFRSNGSLKEQCRGSSTPGPFPARGIRQADMRHVWSYLYTTVKTDVRQGLRQLHAPGTIDAPIPGDGSGCGLDSKV